MIQRKENPASLAASRVPEKIVCLAAAINPEDSRSTVKIQRLRAISRRASLSPAVAAVVAELAFGETRA
ncbi:hypothetical protein M2323_004042 [Rhodoblastus acidophilus]|uniref:hypothetical protein n=1 Tax=Rhodoblastus acidophilus TaxID=1074 RepID=UPI0022249E12|nr:hypothetical protein [Rhodoblastus acidophilus]MCW2286219.1 hypothetical protein [Rhodoblastus acidophilus]MCW2335098.1 hypothetical protein [Rhodoblastus acidophilus]